MADETVVAETPKVEEKPKPKKVEPVSMRQLLESGVHFGHQTRRWNPKMKKYIFTSRNDIHVIDLQKTLVCVNIAHQFVKDIVSKNGIILFVGTKKQAQDAIESESKRCGMPFVNQRWLGGTLTNSVTIRKSVNKLRFLESDEERGVFDKLSKKEASRKKKMLTRLQFYLNGIKDMGRLPDALFVVDTKKEQLAIDEARKLKIPIIGLVDTNADPTEVDYPVPGNDDAIRSVKLICSVIADAVTLGSGKGVGVEETVAQEVSAKEAAASEARKGE